MKPSVPFLDSRRPVSRRFLLRGTGAAISVPFLQAMMPSAFAKSASPHMAKRAVFINLHLGFMAEHFVPKAAGKSYKSTRYLRILDKHREDFTVITGTSHPGVNGAHSADVSFLTGAPDAASASFKNSVSIDQIAAEHIGGETRYAYLPLGLNVRSSSFGHSGANIPAIYKPDQVFRKLFIEGTKREKEIINQQLEDGRSILDFVGESARSLETRLDQQDRDKLDEYFTNIREAEQRLAKNRRWQDIPKPKTKLKPPKNVQDNADFIGKIALMYDMMHLALESDSTRIITFNQPNLNDVLPEDGITQGYHSLSHHNGDAEKQRQLAQVEEIQMGHFARLLDKLKATSSVGSGDESLLDGTMVMMGSIFGNANHHDTRNMPIVLAGGGFEHGQHLAFDRGNNTPTANLFVSMMKKLGVEDFEGFSSSNGELKGLA
ncbi:MAG: DUF1552 domain-containing protein [Verrucomicrobiota bacterium]